MTITGTIKMSFDYTIKESEILQGVIIIQHSEFSDLRGQIWTTFDENLKQQNSLKHLIFKHDKFAVNKRNVLRGVHGDQKSWKLVTAIHGEIFQVVVDLRNINKPPFKHECFELTGSKPTSILIPPGFGNAFLSMSDNSVYHYKLAYEGTYNDYDEQFTIKWNDPRLNINWPCESPILSKRDQCD